MEGSKLVAAAAEAAAGQQYPAPALYVVAAVWPGAAGLMTHTEWDGQVLRKPVEVPGAGWPAR